MSHSVRGNNNIIGDNNVLIAEGSFAGMQRTARARVVQLQAFASRLERWAYGILLTGLTMLALAGEWLPAKLGMTAFGAAILTSVIAIKVAERHRNEAQRIWNHYGLF